MAKTCTITIEGCTATITGDYPAAFVRSITSYPVQGAHFSAAYKKGRWDGRKHLFTLKGATMPSGLVSSVARKLKEKDPKQRVLVVDKRTAPSAGARGLDLCGELKGKFGKGVYDYQLLASEAAIKAKRGILKIATNGGKTAIASAMINHLTLPTLFVVPGVDLLYQTYENFQETLGLAAEDIGMIGDQHNTVGEWVTVATMDSLANRLADGSLDEYKNRWELVFVDECHTAGAETLYEALGELPAYYVFGMSGTPLNRSDGGTLRLIARTGEVIYEVRNKLLVERGISVQPVVKLIRIDEPSIPLKRNKIKVKYAEVEDEGIVNNSTLNAALVNATVNFVDEGKQCILLISKLQQGENLLEMLQDRGCKAGTFTHGKLKAKERKEALTKFVEGEYRYLIGSRILDQGIDVDCIDVMLFAGGGKAVIPTLQRSGRGLRSGRGRTEVIIVDVVNFCHKFLLSHSQERIDTYKAEECFHISLLNEEADPETGR